MKRSTGGATALQRRLKRELAMIAPAEGLSVAPSRLHGLGCFTTRAFSKGRKIAEYGGTLRRWEEMSVAEAPWELNYILDLDGVWVIDAADGGNPTRYINHSCDANVFMRVTRMHAIFYALRDIAPGEELTWRYFLIDDDGYAEPCPCEKQAT
ncbi:MAG: SET domain-containing protein-lysine N-methyltransferase [Blastocatellia bacterium]|nr:SET domain-containing protein-lysine N-methyltransferase [Blastocatellia bacterium]